MGATRAPRRALSPAEQRLMVQALCERLRSAPAPTAVQLIETHISFVLVTPQYAYKLRKAVKLDFVDFSSLARRRRDCREELRLNRRFSPDIYLDVVSVTGTVDAPVLQGKGAAMDCAVKMRTFAQEGLWDRLAVSRGLSAAHIDALVEDVGRFHDSAARCVGAGPLGRPQRVRRPVLESLDTLDRLLVAPGCRRRVAQLRAWEARAFADLRPVFDERRRAGWVRECHGDLHLGNVAQFEGRTRLFDCIEFNREYRWIDVMSDIAFMVMDLHRHGLHAWAHRLINGYLERGGDYAGLRVLRYYLVYRALVRAKVTALQADQIGAAASLRGVRRLLALAIRSTRAREPVVMITHGLSGSGKTTFSQGLIEAAGAIRIRADVERKRLYGLDPLARVEPSRQAALYGQQTTQATYAALCELATHAVQSGFSVVLDATFIRRQARDLAGEFAMRQKLRWVILDFDVDAQTLMQRVRQRQLSGSDASDADVDVLAEQLRVAEPLVPQERARAYACTARSGTTEASNEAAAQVWRRITQRDPATPASRSPD